MRSAVAFVQQRIILWVSQDRVPAYLAAGWVCSEPLRGPYWGYGVEWLCDCPPVFPSKQREE